MSKFNTTLKVRLELAIEVVRDPCDCTEVLQVSIAADSLLEEVAKHFSSTNSFTTKPVSAIVLAVYNNSKSVTARVTPVIKQVHSGWE